MISNENSTQGTHQHVCTVGMFDGVHRGHQLILSKLRELARQTGFTPLVVTFDRHPRVVLGHTDGNFKLLTTNEERFALLTRYGEMTDVEKIHFTPEVAKMSACEFYNEVLSKRLNVKMLLLGYDNMFGNKQKNDFDQLLDLPDVDVVRTEALRWGDVEISSTQIRNRLAAGDIVEANEMLGYSFAVSGRVLHGQAIGRTINFPTANVEIADPLKAMPREGVYAVRVYVDGGEVAHLGIANWGGRPTVGDNGSRLEVHLISFDGDLYDKEVRVEFEYRIRDIKTFATLAELAAQLAADREKANKLFAT